MTPLKTALRRKSLHRSANLKRAKKFAAMRAAKERKRLERLTLAASLPDWRACYVPRRSKPLFVITIRCVPDGVVERLRIYEHALGAGLEPAATLAGRKVAAVIANYRPA